MTTSRRRLLVLAGVVILAFATTLSHAEITYFVATTGNDSNPGTIGAPFKTIAKAQQAIQDLKTGGGFTQPVTVYIRGGTYYLDATLEFWDVDSGEFGKRITYKNYNGENVVVSGGKRITWTGTVGDKWVATGIDWRFRRLRTGNSWGILARWPNYDAGNPLNGGYLFVKNSTNLDTEIKSNVSIPSYNYTGAQLYVFLHDSWITGVFPVTSTDVPSSTFHGNFLNEAGLWVDQGCRFYVQNVLDALDAPGEWFLDTASHTLYYKPRAGETWSDEFVAPYLDELILFWGGDYITIQGIHFKDVQPLDLDAADGISEGYGVGALGAEFDEITQCSFSFLDGAAIGFSDNCTNCNATFNTLENLAGGGIYAGSVERGTGDINIAYNDVSHIGNNNKGAYPLSAGMIRGYIGRNYVHDVPRAGIQCQGGIDTVVELNMIRHIGMETDDMGALYSGGPGTVNTRWRYNYVYDVVGRNTLADGTIYTYGSSNGIAPDTGSSNNTYEGNVFGGRMTHTAVFGYGNNQRIIGNVLLDNGDNRVRVDTNIATTGRAFLDNFVYIRNATAPLVRDYQGNALWKPLTEDWDNNVYMQAGNELYDNTFLTPEGNYAAWQTEGYDAHSTVTTAGSWYHDYVRNKIPQIPAEMWDYILAEIDGTTTPSIPMPLASDQPYLWIDATGSIAENGGTGYPVLVHISHVVSYPVRVLVESESGSAEEGIDFQAVSQYFVIPIGETSVAIPVTPVADAVPEYPEVLHLQVKNSVGAIADGVTQADVTILDLVPCGVKLFYLYE
jgi:hypothetical protein